MAVLSLMLKPEDLKRIGRIGGWAPGNYTGRCLDCRAEIVGDKRASQCFVCAVASINAALTAEVEKPADAVRREAIAFAIKEVEAALEKLKSSPMKGPYFTKAES